MLSELSELGSCIGDSGTQSLVTCLIIEKYLLPLGDGGGVKIVLCGLKGLYFNPGLTTGKPLPLDMSFPLSSGQNDN